MAECLSESFQTNDIFVSSTCETDDEDDFEEFCENFSFSRTSACCVCNGFYAPNFGEPLCGTCHAFLFPVMEEKRATDLSDNDEDSGNDEPPYNPNAVSIFNRNERNEERTSPSNSREMAVIASAANKESRSTMKDKTFSDHCPNPDPPRNLRQYISALTESRDEVGYFGIFAPGPSNEIEKKKLTQKDGPEQVKPATMCDLPVEVLLSVFSYLDDLSLCNVGEVCKQWRKILEIHTPQTMWEKHTKQRWPLFRPINRTSNWFKIYTDLMASCFCRTCLIQMTLKSPSQGNNHFRATRLRGDIRTLDGDPTEGIQAVPLDNTLSHWQASILGPVGSPYEGGKFFIHIMIPSSYPMIPPVVRFLTKIVHPNVSRHGDVGIDIIQHNWSLAITISKLLLSVQSLLTDPFTEVCMEPELGRMYENNRTMFEALARKWTWKYAMTEIL